MTRQDAARLNTPDWLWESWSETYGPGIAREIAASHCLEPPLDITVKQDPDHWARALEAEILPTGTLRRRLGGAIDSLPGFAQGAWWIQDAAAAIIPNLLPATKGLRVLDLCAAPGGKTLSLAARGARVTALDRSTARLDILKANLSRTALDAEILLCDGTEWRAADPFPVVLLDAPCSASGTLRRHPDIAWSKTRRDLGALIALQRRLLEAAIANTAPGGVLLYATCSLEAAEGPRQIERLLAEGASVRRDPIALGEVPGIGDFLTPAGEFRSLPSHWPELGGLDGFFACRLVRC
jgi:16S rRNA (cytosine967-C5)-methyltransferase